VARGARVPNQQARVTMELVPSRVEAFYEFMTERENIRLRRAAGWPRSEWTLDPVFQQYSFTNVKREHDRTTQLLKKEFYDWWRDEHMPTVQGPEWMNDPNEDELRSLLINCAIFRFFGTHETAQTLGWTELWDSKRREQIQAYGLQGDLHFTSAYIVPACGRSEPKYEVLCDVFDSVWSKSRDVIEAINTEESWRLACGHLTQCYGVGSFMAKEILLDYVLATQIYPEDWQTWTPVGPGGCRGAGRILHGRKVRLREAEALEVIREVYDQRGQYWREDFVSLDLTDVQFQMCEIDKWSRVAEGRAPKRKFRPTVDEITDHTRRT
jgi:hypothetical protein